MLAAALRDYVVNYAVAPGRSTLVVTNNDDAYKTAFALLDAGLAVPALLDARDLDPESALLREAKGRGLRVLVGHGIAASRAGKGRKSRDLPAGRAGEVVETIACDAVAMSGGWSPVVHLWSHCGGKLRWDSEGAQFVPDVDNPPRGARGEAFVTPAGAAAGGLTLDAVLGDAFAAGRAAAEAVGMQPDSGQAPAADPEETVPLQPVWLMPEDAGPELRAKAWLDYQNDVKVSDVQLAAQEGV